MQANYPSLGTENQSPYQVESRREILALLRGFKEKGQLISMIISNGGEAFITYPSKKTVGDSITR